MSQALPCERWLSPAKLNLGLRVLGRRPDGYHELLTLFQLLDWGDTIWLRIRRDGQILRHSALPGVIAEHDLAIRAAHALQQASDTTLGVDIYIDKQIPLGGGLGGGSSNAGTVLRALNALWGLHWPAQRLIDLGRPLGADVPLFALGRTAAAAGTGEHLLPRSEPPRRFMLVNPGVHVVTAEVFQAADLPRPQLTAPADPSTIPRLYAEADWRNDCEPVVRRLVPEVARALEWLRQWGSGHLTGTGATVFAVVADPAVASVRLASLPSGWRGWIVRGIDVAPPGVVDSFPVGASPSW